MAMLPIRAEVYKEGFGYDDAQLSCAARSWRSVWDYEIIYGTTTSLDIRGVQAKRCL